MKKITAIMLCLVLAGMVFWGTAQPVNAAGSAHMSIYSSSGTVYRGDRFTLTVNLSNDQPVSNGGIILSYDSSVFEFLGGTCNVAGATLAEVSASIGGGVFALQTDAVVSGTIFTINMRVKEDAAFGTYSISGTPSLSVSCSLSGTGVTVACRHSYENCTQVDGEIHESTCSICGQKRTDAHTWDGGTVTKAATCKETGIRQHTCTGCGATKDETIPVTSDHKYGSWSRTDGYGHSRYCTVCGKQDYSSHRWVYGSVIQKATCQETGSQKLTCSDCGATTTETIPKADHSYGAASHADDTSHKRSCEDCGQEMTEAHTYGEAWEHDENGHFHSCTDCGHENGRADHEPGPKATETTDQICTVCSRVLQPMGAHIHTFTQEWSTDETGHWYVCTDCNAQGSAAPHEFDHDCDADCDTCGMTREPLHEPAGSWSADETGHWHDCLGCGEKLDFVPHTPGPEATITSAQSCTVCQFELAPMIPHDHVFDAQGTLHYHRCACGESYEAGAEDCPICTAEAFPWEIVCIVEAVVFCGIIVVILVWKKKRMEPQPA